MIGVGGDLPDGFPLFAPPRAPRWGFAGLVNMFRLPPSQAENFLRLGKGSQQRLMQFGILPRALVKVLGWEFNSEGKRNKLSLNLVFLSYRLYKNKKGRDKRERQGRITISQTTCRDIFHDLRVKPDVVNRLTCPCHRTTNRKKGKGGSGQPKITSWFASPPPQRDTG